MFYLNYDDILRVFWAGDWTQTYEQITEKAQKLGINLEQPHLKQFLLEN